MELYIDGKNVDDYPQLVYLIISAKFNAWATKMIFTVDVGNEFNTKRVITDSSGKQTFQLQSIAPGAYVVKISFDGITTEKKLIVQ